MRRGEKPMPADYFEAALGMDRAQLAAHFGVGRTTLDKWRKTMTPEQSAAYVLAGKARGIAEKSARFAAMKAARPEEPAKPARFRRPHRAKMGGFNKPTDVAPLSGGAAAMAAQFLRRFYKPVVRGDVLSAALKGYYKLDCEVLLEADMVARARKRGWAPGA